MKNDFGNDNYRAREYDEMQVASMVPKFFLFYSENLTNIIFS